MKLFIEGILIPLFIFFNSLVIGSFVTNIVIRHQLGLPIKARGTIVIDPNDSYSIERNIVYTKLFKRINRFANLVTFLAMPYFLANHWSYLLFGPIAVNVGVITILVHLARRFNAVFRRLAT
jgi:hypothetical protein